MRPRLLAALVVVAVPSAARAAPLAQLAADLDGRGAPEQLSIGGDGVLHVGAAAVPLGAAPTAATLAVGAAKGKPAIVVRVTTGHGAEAVVVTRGGAGWQVAWRGEVGGVGLDAEYAIEVIATPTAILRGQTRFDVRRCDDKPALLFAEELDGGKFVRAGKLPLEIPASAPLLTARVDATPASPPQLFQARAASSDAGATDAGALAIPRELDDGRPETAWRGDEGAFFTFKARGDDKARQLRVLGGDQGSKAKLDAANRPRELAITSAHGAWRVELPDAAHEPLGTAYVVDLPEPITGCVTVVLASTYGGHATTAVSELEVYAEGERAGGGLAELAHAVALDAAGARAKAQQLARGGAPAVAAIDAELARTTEGGARQRLVRVLLDLRDPAAAPLLVRAATSGWVEGGELIAVARALGALHGERALQGLASSRELALDVRVAAAAALDPASPDGRAALLALAGTGPRELRRAVIDQLAATPASALVTEATAAATPATAGDLWRAATRAARAHPAEHAATLAAMRAALATATDYDRRYRLVDGIAALGDAPALAELAAVLAGLPAGTEAGALRVVAARALGKAAAPEAQALLLALAADPDAGVRLAALAALGGREDAAGGADAVDHALGERLAHDGWQEVRVRAAQALGNRCARPGAAAPLVAAAGADATLAVRKEALGALVQCRAAGTGELLARTWADEKLALPLRAHAIALAVALEDRALGGRLVAALGAWRSAAVESKEALQLAVQAATAVGRLGAPGAEPALLDALDDSAFPEIVGAAADGLGALGLACSPAAKAKLTALSRTDDPQVAQPARHAAAACGRAPR